MKYEARAKYSGIKIHCDAKECQELLDWHKTYKSSSVSATSFMSSALPLKFTKDIAKAIKNLLLEHPDLLQDRTEAQVKEALAKDLKKINEQLGTIAKGKDWKQVK